MKEHNNQIVPEILSEITKAQFLVVEISDPNYGAYYEAGIGVGKGKSVIFCCCRDHFDSSEKSERPHFDVAQQSTIVWNDYDDLKSKLTKRILATIPNR
jgi:hypothetical protein